MCFIMKVPPIKLKRKISNVGSVNSLCDEWEIESGPTNYKYAKKVSKYKSKKSAKHTRRSKLFNKSYLRNRHLEVPELFPLLKPSNSTWKNLNKSEKNITVASFLKSSATIKWNLSCNKDWSYLKCFEGAKNGESSITLFAGGPVSCSAFCPLSFDQSCDQFIALAVSKIKVQSHSFKCTASDKGFIQIWNVGKLETYDSSKEVKMVMGIYHNHGVIHDMRWCPGRCNQSLTVVETQESDWLPRLGLLAVACSDSSIRIYCIPHPSSLCKNSGAFPLYHCSPSLILQPPFGGPASNTKSPCSCLDWQESGLCERIAAGYGNGLVCVWHLKESSLIKTDHQVLLPYLTFLAHGSPVTSVSFSPLNECRWLLTSGLDTSLKCFDLMDTSVPFHCTTLGVACGFKWTPQFCAALMSYQDGIFDKGCTFMREFGTETHNLQQIPTSLSCVTHSSFSNALNAVAMTDMLGTVSVNFFKISYDRHTKLALTKACALFETTVVPLTECESSVEKCVSYEHEESSITVMLPQCSCPHSPEETTIKYSSTSMISFSQDHDGSTEESSGNYESSLNSKTFSDFQMLTLNKSCHLELKRRPIEIPINIINSIDDQKWVEGHLSLSEKDFVDLKLPANECANTLKKTKKRSITNGDISDYHRIDCNNNIDPCKASPVSFDAIADRHEYLKYPDGSLRSSSKKNCSSSDGTDSCAADTDSSEDTVIYDYTDLDKSKNSDSEIRTSKPILPMKRRFPSPEIYRDLVACRKVSTISLPVSTELKLLLPNEPKPKSVFSPLNPIQINSQNESFYVNMEDISQKLKKFRMQDDCSSVSKIVPEKPDDEASCSSLSSASRRESLEPSSQSEECSTHKFYAPTNATAAESSVSCRTLENDGVHKDESIKHENKDCPKECLCEFSKFSEPKSLSINYGIIFKDLNKVEKCCSSGSDSGEPRYLPDKLGYLSTITSISWNPNVGCQSWLSAAGNSGVVRIVQLPKSVAKHRM